MEAIPGIRNIWMPHAAIPVLSLGGPEDECLLGCYDDRPDDGAIKHLWNVGQYLRDTRRNIP